MLEKISMKAARTEAGISQGEMAKRLKRSQNLVLDWEKNRKAPRTDDFIAYCEVCGFSPDDVIMPIPLEKN